MPIRASSTAACAPRPAADDRDPVGARPGATLRCRRAGKRIAASAIRRALSVTASRASPCTHEHPSRMSADSRRRPRSVSPCRRRAAKSEEQPTRRRRPAASPSSSSSTRRPSPRGRTTWHAARPSPPGRRARVRGRRSRDCAHGPGALAEERTGAASAVTTSPVQLPAPSCRPECRGHVPTPAGASPRAAPPGLPRARATPRQPRWAGTTQAPQPAQRSALKRMRRKVRTRSGTRKGPLGSWRAIRRSAAPEPTTRAGRRGEELGRVKPVVLPHRTGGHALTQRPQPTHSSS